MTARSTLCVSLALLVGAPALVAGPVAPPAGGRGAGVALRLGTGGEINADLAISKSNGVTRVVPGGSLSYLIVAENNGPDDVPLATVSDSFPAELVGCSWSCLSTGGASCAPGPVAGDITDDISLPAGAAASYTVACDVDQAASGTLTNTATIEGSPEVMDPFSLNNSATDLDDIAELDFGDLPDPPFSTVLTSDAARHGILPGFFLGSGVDGETEGLPSAGADGDDLDGVDDEDGVTFLNGLGIGGTAEIEVVASAAGVLDAWVDFNADGSFGDPGEQVFSGTALVAGSNELAFPIDAAAVTGATFARFRLSSSGGLTPSGLTNDGEVEDYAVEIVHEADMSVVFSLLWAPRMAGEVQMLEVATTNNGPSPATDATLSVTLPTDGIFLGTTPGSPECDDLGGFVFCDLGSLPVDLSRTDYIYIRVFDRPSAGTGEFLGEAGSALPDPFPANDTASADFEILPLTRLAPLPDVTADGSPEVGVLTEGSVEVSVLEVASGVEVNRLSFFPDGWFPVALEAAPDLDGNGAEDLLVVAIQETTGTVRAKARDPLTGAQTASRDFPSDFPPLAAAVLADGDGAGTPAVAVTGRRAADGKVRMFRKLLTGPATPKTFFLSSQVPLDLEAVASFGGTAAQELALLAVRATDAKARIQMKDAESREALGIIPLNADHFALDIETVADFADSEADELAILGRSPDAADNRVQLKDAASKVNLGFRTFDGAFPAIDLEVVPSFGGEAAEEICVVGRRPSDDKVKAALRDAVDNTFLGNVFFPDAPGPVDLVTVPDGGATAADELGLLRVDPTDGSLTVTVKDAGDGSVVGGGSVP